MWAGLLLSAIGTWMQIVAQSVLVLRLSHGSAFALGCVSLSQASAFFGFALLGGGMVDRLNRKKLLVITQSCLMLNAATLGALTALGIVNVPIIVASAFVSGLILSFDQPARAALVSTLVPEDDLLNAIALQSAVFNAAAVVGPAIAGIVLDGIGIAADFFLNAISFGAILIALPFVTAKRGTSLGREKLVTQIRDVLAAIRRDSLLVSALFMYGVLLFAGPSLQLLLPVLAVNRLHISGFTLGILFSAAGIGAVAGAVILGTRHSATVRFAQVALGLWCAALAVAGSGITVPITFCALLVMGAGQSIVGSTTSALLQTRVAAHQRGRAMSLNTLLLMGVRPLGDFPAGAMIAAFGAPVTAIASAALVAILAIAVNTSVKRPASA